MSELHIDEMSELIPFHGGRSKTWEQASGPMTDGEVPDVASDDDLPPVDYNDIGYDSWTCRMSLKNDGLAERF